MHDVIETHIYINYIHYIYCSNAETVTGVRTKVCLPLLKHYTDMHTHKTDTHTDSYGYIMDVSGSY